MVDKLEENGLMFVGRDVENERMEILELKGFLRLSHFCCLNLQITFE